MKMPKPMRSGAVIVGSSRLPRHRDATRTFSCRAPVAWCQMPRMSRASIVVIVLLLPAARAPACPELPIAPDATNPYELQFGATNVNGALGNGALTAAFSRCGELTVFKWPGPSYYNQLAYLTDNVPGVRTLPHLGALDGMGAF